MWACAFAYTDGGAGQGSTRVARGKPAKVWSRGERQVCAMVHPPTRAAEDARRLGREREALLAERIRHANRIKELLATQGVFDFEPTLRNRRARLAEVRTPPQAFHALRAQNLGLLRRKGRRCHRASATRSCARWTGSSCPPLAFQPLCGRNLRQLRHAAACGGGGDTRRNACGRACCRCGPRRRTRRHIAARGRTRCALVAIEGDRPCVAIPSADADGTFGNSARDSVGAGRRGVLP